MRYFLVFLNSAVGILFLLAFLLTFFARGAIDAAAREFVTAKTVEFSEPLVRLAEKAADDPLAKRLLSKPRKAAIAREIADYHSNPARYISELTKQAAAEKSGLLDSPPAARIAGWKVKVRAYYDKVLGKVVGDLRIFTGTTCLAGLLAAGLAWHGKGKARAPLVVISCVLAVATMFSAWYYIDGFTFFGIVSDSLMGWGYPVMIFMIFFWIVLELNLSTDRQTPSPFSFK